MQGRSEEGARDSVLEDAAFMHSFAFVITDSHCTRPASMYEGRVFLKQMETLVYGHVGGACLDLVWGSKRLTQEMFGLRILVRKCHIYKYARKEKSWNGSGGII